MSIGKYCSLLLLLQLWFDGVKFNSLKIQNQGNGYMQLFFRRNLVKVYLNYRNEFRAIHSSNLNLTKAQIIWRNNWITFIEGALQFCTLRHDHSAVSQPQYIKRICIDINTQLFELRDTENMNDTLLDAIALDDQFTVR